MATRFFTLIIFLFTVAKMTCFAQNNFEKIFIKENVEKINTVKSTSDGGYILSGNINDSAIIIKLTSTGEVNWKNSLSGISTDAKNSTDAIELNNGSYALFSSVIAGDHLNLSLQIYDGQGNFINDYEIANDENETAHKLIPTYDNGLVLAGNRNNTPILYKLNNNYILQWEYLVPLTSFTAFFDIVVTMDSSFVITYNKNLIKISSTGQEVWKESINERATLLVENADW